MELDHSLVTKAILQGGVDWEERVLDSHLVDQVIVADGDERESRSKWRHSVVGTLEKLGSMQPGDDLYQPTLRPPPGFYERYGIDPEVIQFVDCYPDLLTVVDGVDGPEIAVIDVKASDMMKLAHRIQVGLYALILRDVDAAVDRPACSKHRTCSISSMNRLGSWLHGSRKGPTGTSGPSRHLGHTD